MAAKKKQSKAKKAPKKSLIGQEKGIPAGRPKGAKNKTTLVKEATKGHWDELMMTDAKRVFQAVVEKALDGDTSCMKMILDRAVPVTKAVDIDAITSAGNKGITIHIEKLVADTGRAGDEIEDGIVIE